MAFIWTVVFVITFIFSIKPAIGDFNNYDREGWEQAAKYLLEGFNSKVKACDDFVQYACGNWITKSDGEAQYQFAATRIKFMKELKEAIEAIDVKDDIQNYKKSVKAMYDQCQLNRTMDIKTVVKHLYHGMVEILGTPPIFSKNPKAKETLLKENVWHLLGKVRRELPKSILFFNVEIQKTDTPCGDKQASLLLIPQVKIVDDVTVADILEDVHHLASIINLGLDDKEIERGAENIVKFQQAINAFINSTEDLDESFSTKVANQTEEEYVAFRIVTVEELVQFNPNISWVEYFRGLFSNEQFDNWNQSRPAITIVDQQRFFENVDDILTQFDTETVFNYIFWRSMKSMFIQQKVTDDSGEIERKNCLSTVTDMFKAATARIYFDHFKIDPLEVRNDLNIIAKTVFSAFKFLIATTDWLDADEKLAVIDKVEKISFYSGIPDWIDKDDEIDRKTLRIRPDVSPVENKFTILKKNFDHELDYVVGLGDLNLEQEPELEVNAQYSAMSVIFDLGILTPPFYSPKYPLAAKYGFIGYVIGHELLHGFGLNRINEILPNGESLLKEETMKQYKKKLDCIIKQYSSFCYKKKCVHGGNTQGENLADIDGLKIAYMAYKFARETLEEEPPFPNFVDLTGDQLFFLFYGRSHCTSGGEVERKLLMNEFGEPHPPSTARLIIPIRNFPTFAKSFECVAGSTYAPSHTCSVWGSYKASNRAKH